MSTTPRRSRGYVGRDHQTVGSDILAVQGAVTSPVRSFDPETLQRLQSVKADGWYPIGWLLDVMDQLHVRVGDAGLRRMGRELFRRSHAEKVRTMASSAHDILQGFDGRYRSANRGTAIGGWEVGEFRPGYAEMVKTTPHHCVMEEGTLVLDTPEQRGISA